MRSSRSAILHLCKICSVKGCRGWTAALRKTRFLLVRHHLPRRLFSLSSFFNPCVNGSNCLREPGGILKESADLQIKGTTRRTQDSRRHQRTSLDMPKCCVSKPSHAWIPIESRGRMDVLTLRERFTSVTCSGAAFYYTLTAVYICNLRPSQAKNKIVSMTMKQGEGRGRGM